jgi:hypothetical protein
MPSYQYIETVERNHLEQGEEQEYKDIIIVPSGTLSKTQVNSESFKQQYIKLAPGSSETYDPLLNTKKWNILIRKCVSMKQTKINDENIIRTKIETSSDCENMKKILSMTKNAALFTQRPNKGYIRQKGLEIVRDHLTNAIEGENNQSISDNLPLGTPCIKYSDVPECTEKSNHQEENDMNITNTCIQTDETEKKRPRNSNSNHAGENIRKKVKFNDDDNYNNNEKSNSDAPVVVA